MAVAIDVTVVVDDVGMAVMMLISLIALLLLQAHCYCYDVSYSW